MGARHKARKRAVSVVYEADLRGVPVHQVVAEQQNRPAEPASPAMADYSVELTQTVTHQLERIDELISTYSQDWTLERMPAVDRAIARVGIAELLLGQVPPAVVLDESVQLATELSTDQSPTFLNGLLAQISAITTPASSG